jgi:opacity protein-like surface antigen
MMLALVAAVLAACASGPQYRSDYDQSVDFDSYETWAFVDTLGTDRAGYSSLITNHFKDAIRAEMQSLGYRYSESSPDLLVNFAANAQDVTEVRSRPTPTVGAAYGYGYYGYRTGMYATFPMYTNEVETVRYKEGTANVDVVDAAENRLIWEGIVEGRLSKEAMENPRPAIFRVVGGIFDRYPTATSSD